MNDYTLYLVKRAYYKKQLIKQASMNKHALSEESAKNINPALLDRFRVYERIGEHTPGTGSIATRYIQNEVNKGKTTREAVNTLLGHVYFNAEQGWNHSIRTDPYGGHADIPVGTGMTNHDYFRMADKENDRRDRKGMRQEYAAVDKHNKKTKGSKSTALVPYVAPVEPEPEEAAKAGVPWGRYAAVGGSALAGGNLGYAGSNWLSKKLGLKGKKGWRRAGDIALRTLGTAGGAAAAGLGAGALYDRYVK